MIPFPTLYSRRSVSNMYNHKLRNDLYFKYTYSFTRLKDKDIGQANTKERNSKFMPVSTGGHSRTVNSKEERA